jgi:hypothetical protein
MIKVRRTARQQLTFNLVGAKQVISGVIPTTLRVKWK